jgi:hypothetical protein
VEGSETTTGTTHGDIFAREKQLENGKNCEKKIIMAVIPCQG